MPRLRFQAVGSRLVKHGIHLFEDRTPCRFSMQTAKLTLALRAVCALRAICLLSGALSCLLSAALSVALSCSALSYGTRHHLSCVSVDIGMEHGLQGGKKS